jgi:hypothetical protein
MRPFKAAPEGDLLSFHDCRRKVSDRNADWGGIGGFLGPANALTGVGAHSSGSFAKGTLDLNSADPQ